MDEDLVRGLQYMTAQLAVLLAAVHLVVALPRLSAALVSGTVPRPSTLLFVLAAAGVVAGLVGFASGTLSHRTVYHLGLVIMVGQVVGWFVYHNLGLFGFGHSHGSALLANTYEHFVGDPVEAAAVTAEAMAAAFLFVLLQTDPELDGAGSEASSTGSTRA